MSISSLTTSQTITNCTPKLIQGIKEMLRDGCTPLHIIQYLYSLHNPSERWQSFVSECFYQAFGVSLLTTLPDQYELLLSNRRIQDRLNTELLHEIVANQYSWTSGLEGSESSFWMDDLKATDIWMTTRQFDPQSIPEIASIWSQLEPCTQEYIRLMIVNAKVHSEQALILARLSERLQQKETHPI